MKIFTLCLALFFPLFSQSQSAITDIRFESGEKIPTSARRSLPQVLAKDVQGGIYALQTKSKRTIGLNKVQPIQYKLQYYDSQLNLKESRKLDLKKNGTRLNYQFSAKLGGSQYLFTSFFNPEKGKEILLAQKYGEEKLDLEEARVVAELENPDKNGFFRFESSEGENYLLIAFKSVSEGEKNQKIELIVLDENLKQVWKKEDGLSQLGSSFIVEEFRVDNKGNAYLLSTLFSDNRAEKRQGAPDYQYYLSSFRNNGSKQEHFGIKLQDKFITDLQIKLGNDDDIIGGGFYANKGSFEVKGSYFFSIDGKSSQVVNKSIKEFEPGFLSHQLSAVGLESGAGRFKLRQYGFTLKDILLREDGGAVLLGEQYFVSAATSFKGRAKKVKSQYFYDFNDIIVININGEGQIKWAEKVEKQQRSCNDGGFFSSFASMLSGDDLYLFYNANIRGSASSGAKVRRSSSVAVTKVDGEGVVSYQSAPFPDGKVATIIPKSAESLGNTGILFLAQKKNKNYFIKVTAIPSGVLSLR